MSLNKLFKPKSVAIIGASPEKGSVGNALYVNALSAGNGLKVFPVNIKRRRIGGKAAFASVAEIKQKIDLAIIATPALTVPAVIKECVAAKVGAAIIISAGFGETGKAGEALLADLRREAEEGGMRILGPNCLGFLDPKHKLNLSFAAKQALPGRTAFISQSGALCTAILDWSLANGVGFSKFVSIGSVMDVGFADIIDYLADDKDTDNIILYMESLKDVDAFRAACARLPKGKRVFALKSGRSQAGANAAKSHTGSLAGSDAAFDALFRQCGITRMEDTHELCDIIRFASGQVAVSSELAIITNAGGPGVLSTDALYHLGGHLAKLKPSTIKALDAVLPASWSHGNPVDIIGDAAPERYEAALKVLLQSPEVGSIFIVLTPQAMTEPLEVAKRIVRLVRGSKKTVFASFLGASDVLLARNLLTKAGIAVFGTPERAICAFVRFTSDSKRSSAKDSAVPKIDLPEVERVLDKMRKERRKQASEDEAKAIMAAAGFSVLPSILATDAVELSRKLKSFKFPVAMKVHSPDIMHKVDCGGVELNIRDIAAAKAAFTRIMSSSRKAHPHADIRGVLVEPMAGAKLELIIGLSHDPIMDQLIMFGRGGTEVELYKDVAFGVLPMTRNEIAMMIAETKTSRLLDGYRNVSSIGLAAIVDLVARIAELAALFPEIKELDINPLSVDAGGAVVLDAKLTINN